MYMTPLRDVKDKFSDNFEKFWSIFEFLVNFGNSVAQKSSVTTLRFFLRASKSQMACMDGKALTLKSDSCTLFSMSAHNFREKVKK